MLCSGATAYVTRASTQDYSFTGFGAAVGFNERFELSLARQDLTWKRWAEQLAYVDLGRILPGVTAGRRQTGFYVSAQLAC